MKIQTILCFVFLLSALVGCKTSAPPSSNKNTMGSKTYTAEELKTDGLFLEACSDKNLGNLSKAEEKFRKVLSITKGNYAAAHFHLADALFRQQKFEEAIQHAKQAVEMCPDNVWYTYELILLYQQVGQFSHATKLYEKILKKHPEKQEYYYELAKNYLFEKKFDEMIDIWDKYERRFGISEEISMHKYQIYLEQKKYAKAANEIQKLKKHDPNEVKYTAILAETYMKQKDYTQAKKYYQEILKQSPNDPHIHISLANLYRLTNEPEKTLQELKLGFANPNLDIKIKLSLLGSFYSLNQFLTTEKDKAFQLLNILKETHPLETTPLSMTGGLFLQDQKYAEAADAFREAIQLGDKTYLTFEQLLYCLAKQTHSESEILTLCDTIINLYPEQPLPYLVKGDLLLNDSSQYKSAVLLMEQGMVWVVDNKDLEENFYGSLAEGYYRLGVYDKSDLYFRKAIKINPQNYSLMNNFAYYLALRNEALTEAQSLIEKVLLAHPKNATFLDTYAWVLYMQKKYAEARTTLEKALSLTSSPSATLLEHYGDILFHCGEIEQAVSFWKKAKSQGGNTPSLLLKIEQKTLIENQ